MKYILSVTVLFLLCFSACKKEDDSSAVITATGVSSTVSSGTWRITYFFDSGTDETSDFNNYAFAFSGSNVLTAVNSGTTVTGTWATGTDDSKVKLDINFLTPADFSELSEDWQVIERSATKIRLQHVSGGGGGTDLLTFEKN